MSCSFVYCLINVFKTIETLARLRAGQRDGHQTDNDFRRWVKTPVLFLAVSGPKSLKFWDDALSLWSSTPEILALKLAIKL